MSLIYALTDAFQRRYSVLQTAGKEKTEVEPGGSSRKGHISLAEVEPASSSQRLCRAVLQLT